MLRVRSPDNGVLLYFTECQLIFGFKLPSAIIDDKTKRFLIKYDSVNNLSRLPCRLVILDACLI